MKKNSDLIKDFVAGVKYVYLNETDKHNLNYLADLKEINKFKRN